MCANMWASTMIMITKQNRKRSSFLWSLRSSALCSSAAIFSSLADGWPWSVIRLRRSLGSTHSILIFLEYIRVRNTYVSYPLFVMLCPSPLGPMGDGDQFRRRLGRKKSGHVLDGLSLFRRGVRHREIEDIL